MYHLENEIDQIMKDFDTDGNGEVSLDEFIAFVHKFCSKEDIEEGRRKAFQMFDRNGDGRITPVEFKKTMKEIGLKLSDDQVYAMMEKADVNGDGEIDYKEFVALMAESKQ